MFWLSDWCSHYDFLFHKWVNFQTCKPPQTHKKETKKKQKQKKQKNKQKNQKKETNKKTKKKLKKKLFNSATAGPKPG